MLGWLELSIDLTSLVAPNLFILTIYFTNLIILIASDEELVAVIYY